MLIKHQISVLFQFCMKKEKLNVCTYLQIDAAFMDGTWNGMWQLSRDIISQFLVISLFRQKRNQTFKFLEVQKSNCFIIWCGCILLGKMWQTIFEPSTRISAFKIVFFLNWNEIWASSKLTGSPSRQRNKSTEHSWKAWFQLLERLEQKTFLDLQAGHRVKFL